MIFIKKMQKSEIKYIYIYWCNFYVLFLNKSHLPELHKFYWVVHIKCDAWRHCLWKWRLIFSMQGLAEELSKDGACEKAIFPDTNIVITRCAMIGNLTVEGVNNIFSLSHHISPENLYQLNSTSSRKQLYKILTCCLVHVCRAIVAILILYQAAQIPAHRHIIHLLM